MSRSRRQFLADMAKGACGVGLLGVGLGGMARQQAAAVPAQALRLPAAPDGAAFLSSCAVTYTLLQLSTAPSYYT
ncbi:hypothetical protein ACQ4LF_24620, partial [Aeromonas salmonicida]